LDLRRFTAWCWQRQHRVFEVRRVDIECFARDLEDRGKSRATVARPLLERRHRTLTVLRRGGKLVTMPRAPRVARAVDLARWGNLWKVRSSSAATVNGSIGMLPSGSGAVSLAVPGSASGSDPPTLRHALITAAPDAGVPLRDLYDHPPRARRFVPRVRRYRTRRRRASRRGF
jgi:hypothetical protein